MNWHRAILAASLALPFGLAVGGGGCANGGSGDTSGGDDDSGTTADVTMHEGGGNDAATGCPSGKTSCSGVCTDTLTDGKNCGGCGHTCGTSQVCNDGTCGYSCAPPETLCNAPPEGGSAAEGGGGAGDDAGEPDGGSPAADSGSAGTDAASSDAGGAPYCANLTNDNNNCGACGNACGPNHTCSTVAGTTACGLSCPTGTDPCIASDTCIPSGTCCASCPVPDQVCPMPGGMCQCPGGETLCMATSPGQCISSNDCCTLADCSGVAGSTCPTPGQACQCPNGDKVCLSGKTCIAQTACCTAAGACCQDPLGKSCSAATAQGALTVGGTPLSVSGLSTATGEEDWIQVTFSGQTNLAFHGHVIFTTNPNNEFVFDIASDCMGTLLSCGTESTTCSGKTEWEETYAALTPVQNPTGTTWKPVPVTVVNIRVYRANATAAPTCDQWTLAISE
jgi:hypothetical protein